MEHKIISQNKNVLLNREEFMLKITADKNPTKKEVSDLLNKDESLTIVKSVKGSFGKGDFDAEVIVYNSKEAKDNIERPNRKTRKKAAEEAKKAKEVAKNTEVKT